MALGRQIEMKVISNKTTIVDISNLFIEFDIERTLILSPNKANFTIYNAKEQTRNDVLKKDNLITFKAGHEDENNIASIFYGVICTSNSYKSGTEMITKVTAQDLAGTDNGLVYQYVAYSYKEKTKISQVFNDIADALNLSLYGIDNLTDTLNNGFTFSGSVGKLLYEMRQTIRQSGLEIYIDDNTMVIYKIGKQVSRFGIVRIPSNNIIGGIENVEDTTRQDNRKRIKFDCILNPKIKPNTLVNVQGEYTKGTFITEKAKFVGNNFGGDFKCTVEAAE